MKLERCISVSIILLVLLWSTACEKVEISIAKPPKGPAQIAQVEMGDDYADQIFFNFSTGQPVMKSRINSWDLAFEASPEGFHVFMNGGKDLLLYNTRNTDAGMVREAQAYQVKDTDWGYDGASGLPDSTYVQDWRGKNETFIVKFNDGSYKKIVFKTVDKDSYVILCGDINSTVLSSFTIHKDLSYNYVYFSFEGNKQVYPEPAKNTWDIVFTRYRYIYYDINLRYVVTGVLLNPYYTYATADSVSGFSNIVYQAALHTTLSNHRDIIGFDWKKYNFTSGRYQTDLTKCYIIKTQKDQHWKLRFLDFYNDKDMKGSPSFEFDRIH